MLPRDLPLDFYIHRYHRGHRIRACSVKETIERRISAAVAGLIGIGPKDELGGMIAAQLLACHNAAMECYRRAVHGEQTFVGRSENLSQANKISRSFATLREALNRHRGKGQQKVTGEHVHVHAGGQAVVGMVGTPGGGYHPNSEEQPDAKGKSETSVGALSMDDASLPALRGGARTRRATLCQSPAMTNGRCRMHGGASIRRGRLSAYGRT